MEQESVQEQALQGLMNRLLVLRDELYQQETTRLRAAAWVRAEVLALLPILDGGRKGRVVRFLYELGLIGGLDAHTQRPAAPIIKLDGADLRDMELPHASLGWVQLVACFLDRANFMGSFLGQANLGASDLPGANLKQATLTGANLYLCDLREANLTGADLGEARVTEGQLAVAIR
jgi:hypothetical protein